MEHSLATNPKLSKWSWQEIQGVYRVYGQQLKHYQQLKNRIDIPETMHIEYTDESNIFISRFWREIKRLDLSVTQLDREISRRQKLIGVMG